MINECAQCNHQFQPSDKNIETCPKCKSEDIIFDVETLEMELEEDRNLDK